MYLATHLASTKSCTTIAISASNNYYIDQNWKSCGSNLKLIQGTWTSAGVLGP